MDCNARCLFVGAPQSFVLFIVLVNEAYLRYPRAFSPEMQYKLLWELVETHAMCKRSLPQLAGHSQLRYCSQMIEIEKALPC